MPIAGYIPSSQGDRRLMARSVEGPFPFLDKDVVAPANSHPPPFELRVLDEKDIVKRVSQLHVYLTASARRLPATWWRWCAGVDGSPPPTSTPDPMRWPTASRRAIERGDRLVMFADNTVEAVITFSAILRANAVVSVVNPWPRTRSWRTC
jgi:hypothetical protein